MNYITLIKFYQMIWRNYMKKEFIDILKEISKEKINKTDRIFDYTITEGSNIKEEKYTNNINKMKEIVNETKSIEKSMTEFIKEIEEHPSNK